jgi:hypothetical protein
MADDGAVEDISSALAPLPPAIVLFIFAQLPVDLRARCACVCRGWRATLSERSLWTRLDVSRTSGVTKRVTDELLRGAAARAGGELQALDVSGCLALSHEALLAVATANADSLRELRHAATASAKTLYHVALANPLSLEDAQALLRAAPRLRVLDADVGCGIVADARRALRAEEGLLAPLRAHGLRLWDPLGRRYFDPNGAGTEADVLALAADVAGHAWLQELCLHGRRCSRRCRPTRTCARSSAPAATSRRRLRRVCCCRRCAPTAACAPWTRAASG